MVGFVYTKTASLSDLQESLDNFAEKEAPDTRDEVESQTREIQEIARQIEMSRYNIDSVAYQQLKTTADASSTTVQGISQQLATDSSTNAAGAQSADNVDYDLVRDLTPEERERFEQGEMIGTDAEPVAVSVSGVGQYTDESNNAEPVGVVEDDRTPSVNPLHKFLTYTYGLSLHYMDMLEYNLFISKKIPYTPKKNRVLIASGGRRNDYLVRNKNFNLDFYITDLKMMTIIGIGNETKGTNSVQIDFTIVEPLSASFLEKLVTVAQEADIKAWIEMPLILQIDFFGHQEDGTYSETPLEGLSKFICIKLSDIRFEITSRGTEYRCVAIPVSHTALQKNTVSIPANFEVTAKTVGEFFASTSNEIGIDLTTYDNTASTANKETREEASKKDKTSKPKGISTLSLADALNEYQKALIKGKPGRKYQDTADEFVFVIDKEIAESKILVPDKHNLSSAPAQNDKVRNDNLDINRGVFPVNAGSNLIEVINQVIRSSEYYRQKIEPDKPTGEDEKVSKGRPISIHKIVPKIEFLQEWDSIRKTYRKRITYYIRKYEFHNDKNPKTRKSLPKRPDRYYDYIYMGKNQDVINLKIEFNTLWFQALTSFESKTSEDNLDLGEESNTGFDPTTGAGEFGGARQTARVNLQTSDKTEMFPVKTLAVPVSRASSQLSDGSRKSVQAVDLYTSIFNRPGGDMVNLQLEIAGDPDFIKQDDVFFPPSIGESDSDDLSTSSDKRQLFIELRFKIPTDINLDTGLYDFEKKDSAFSGLYEVIHIENTFKDGIFTQKLQCNRLFNQEKVTESRGSGNTGGEISSTGSGLSESNEDYEAELNNAALLANQENNRQSPTASVNETERDNSTTNNYAFYQDWETKDATDASDLQFPGG